MRRPALSVLVVAVVAMHASALWLMQIASQTQVKPAGPVIRVAMELVQIVSPTTPLSPAHSAHSAHPTTVTRNAPSRIATRPSSRGISPAAYSEAITQDAPVSPVASVESPPAAPLILNSEATRRAIGEVTRRQSFADRASQDLGSPARAPFDTPLSAGIAGAARGDCTHGQFKGNNMGLLSLPMLAIAVARGDCRP